MSTIQTEVIVVGAGPTGLTVATALAQRGRRTVVLDSQPEGSNTSRAAVVHARTLEMFDRLGVAAPLVELGLHATRFSIRDRDRVLVPLRFDRLPTDGTHVSGRYLVAADGMHGSIRDQLGVAFPATRYEESFSLADVHLTGTIGRRLRGVRNVLLYLLAHLPAFRKRLAWELSGLVYRPGARLGAQGGP